MRARGRRRSDEKGGKRSRDFQAGGLSKAALEGYAFARAYRMPPLFKLSEFAAYVLFLRTIKIRQVLF